MAIRERSEIVQKKQEIDASMRRLKQELQKARAQAATRGVYMDRAEYHLARLKQESQALQTRLGELKKAEKAENTRVYEQERMDFRQAAYELLPSDLFQKICDLAELCQEYEVIS